MSKQKNMTGQIATLKKVMHYLKHYIPILILSVVLATVTVALTLYFPILTGRAIDLILDKGNVDFPGILAIAKEGVIVIGITAAAQWIMNMCNNRMTYRCPLLPCKMVSSTTGGTDGMDMSYQIVELEEKTVVGLTARMRNDDPECGAAIGALWRRLFEEGIFFAVPHPADDHSIGLYDAYETDMTGPYDVTIGRAVTDAAERPAGTAVKTIPAGRYAEFVVRGDVQRAVGEFWTEVWKLPLDRAYTADFEEYWPEAEGEEQEIHVFLSLKQEGEYGGQAGL